MNRPPNRYDDHSDDPAVLAGASAPVGSMADVLSAGLFRTPVVELSSPASKRRRKDEDGAVNFDDDAELQTFSLRITQVAQLIRNLATTEENAAMMSKSALVLRFVARGMHAPSARYYCRLGAGSRTAMAAVHAHQRTLQIHCMEAFESLAPTVDLGRFPVDLGTLRGTLFSMLSSKDRWAVTTSASTYGQMVRLKRNHTKLEAIIGQSELDRFAELLLVEEIHVALYTLEALNEITAIESLAGRLGKTYGVISTLVSRLTFRLDHFAERFSKREELPKGDDEFQLFGPYRHTVDRPYEDTLDGLREWLKHWFVETRERTQCFSREDLYKAYVGFQEGNACVNYKTFGSVLTQLFPSVTEIAEGGNSRRVLYLGIKSRPNAVPQLSRRQSRVEEAKRAEALRKAEAEAAAARAATAKAVEAAAARAAAARASAVRAAAEVAAAKAVAMREAAARAAEMAAAEATTAVAKTVGEATATAEGATADTVLAAGTNAEKAAETTAAVAAAAGTVSAPISAAVVTATDVSVARSDAVESTTGAVPAAESAAAVTVTATAPAAAVATVRSAAETTQASERASLTAVVTTAAMAAEAAEVLQPPTEARAVATAVASAESAAIAPRQDEVAQSLEISNSMIRTDTVAVSVKKIARFTGATGRIYSPNCQTGEVQIVSQKDGGYVVEWPSGHKEWVLEEDVSMDAGADLKPTSSYMSNGSVVSAAVEVEPPGDSGSARVITTPIPQVDGAVDGKTDSPLIRSPHKISSTATTSTLAISPVKPQETSLTLPNVGTLPVLRPGFHPPPPAKAVEFAQTLSEIQRYKDKITRFGTVRAPGDIRQDGNTALAIQLVSALILRNLAASPANRKRLLLYERTIFERAQQNPNLQVVLASCLQLLNVKSAENSKKVPIFGQTVPLF